MIVANRDLVPAAQYARMSTEHQSYSITTQSIAIQKYARQRGFQIVQSYADEGKSGLDIDGRPALSQLIKDVTSGAADFKAVLVYDISRWGRFQDADESAYYEYLCRRVGISIHYCVEPFENDGTPFSTVIKSLKRVMAGEYSRDLSARTFAGQSHQVALGYRQGGTAGLGYRRMLIGKDGELKGILKRGETKHLSGDKVILVLGPREEVDAVRWMFHAYVHDEMTGYEIAAGLNERNLTTPLGNEWTAHAVYIMLRNEKYLGNNVWGRLSTRLKSKPTPVPPERWARADAAFEPIVEPGIFEAAQQRLGRGRNRYTRVRLIRDLQRLYAEHGRLTADLIDQSPGIAGCSTYLKHFESLSHAYAAVGFHRHPDLRYRPTRKSLGKLREQMLLDISTQIEAASGQTRPGPGVGELTINDQLTVLVRLARINTDNEQSIRWIFRYPRNSSPDLVVGVRLEDDDCTPRDYFLLPPELFTSGQVYVSENNSLRLDGMRSPDLRPLIEMSAQTPISEMP